MSEQPLYLLKIWEDDNKDCQCQDWTLEYHFIYDPAEILQRIKKFKQFNSKWAEWKPSIYEVKEVNIETKTFVEDVKSSIENQNIWQQIKEELKAE